MKIQVGINKMRTKVTTKIIRICRRTEGTTPWTNVRTKIGTSGVRATEEQAKTMGEKSKSICLQNFNKYEEEDEGRYKNKDEEEYEYEDKYE